MQLSIDSSFLGRRAFAEAVDDDEGFQRDSSTAWSSCTRPETTAKSAGWSGRPNTLVATWLIEKLVM